MYISRFKSGIEKCREHLKFAMSNLSENLCYLCQQPAKSAVCKVCEQDCLFFNSQKIASNLLNWPVIRGGLTPGHYHSLTAMSYYQWPLDYLITQFKYGHPQLVSMLSEWFIKYAPLDHANLPDCLLPVPISLWKMNRRRYHQTLLLANQLGAHYGISVIENWASRQLWQPSQKSLGRRERLKNLKQAYYIKATSLPGRVAIIDDVVTTGATIATLSRALKQRFPGIRIEVWALAVTPARPDFSALEQGGQLMSINQ